MNCFACEAYPDEKKACEREIHELREALRWYVETDDVVEGMEGNEYWTEGKHRAMRLLGMK